MNILIADSGGTKTDWVCIGPAERQFFSGEGLHPAYHTVKKMMREISVIPEDVRFNIDQVFFYGAGCHGKEPVKKVRTALQNATSAPEIDVQDDLTGAGRAHLQDRDGLIAALGTGSICGRYSGGKITDRSLSLGYILGDEGSAAHIGKEILRAYFRNELDEHSVIQVQNTLGTEGYSVWMNKIYGSEQPNRELASVAGQVLHEECKNELLNIVTGCFEQFLDTQFRFLRPQAGERIVFTGSVANAHSGHLHQIVEDRGFDSFSVKSGVIAGLADYHG